MAENSAGNPPPPPSASPEQPAKPQPYGPGLLMAFGLGLLAFAAWCFYDLYLGGAGEKWQTEGSVSTLWFNRIGMAVGVVGAAYAFILAAMRSRKPPEPKA